MGGQKQEEADHGKKIDQVAGINDTSGNIG